MIRSVLSRLFWVIAGCATGWIISSLWSSVWAHADVDLRPAWSETGSIERGTNISFLHDTRQSMYWGPEIFRNILDPNQATQMRQQYEDMNRDYNLKKKFGLVSQYDEQNHVGQVSDFSHSLVSEVQQEHTRNVAQKAKDIYDHQSDGVKTAVKAIAAPGALYALATGQPVDFSVAPNTDMHAHTDVRNKTGGFSMNSPWVSGEADFSALMPDREFLTTTAVDPSQERYRFSLSKNWSFWDLSSSLSYGTSSTALDASFSKPLFDHITCQVDAIHFLDPSIGVYDDTVRLNYGISF